MDEASTSAILAFYNLLAAKIGLEDCRSLKDVYNLMPILANCMEHGTPIFVDDPNFGYRNAIALIALELDEEFHSQLNSEAAEGGDEFEAAKIHLAMIYTFRLVQTEAFSTICEQLEVKHQRNFAYMIERLDDRHRWTSHPWPKLLHSDRQHSDDKDENKENGGDKAERVLFSSLHVARTPKLINTGRKSLFVPSTNSPVKEVVDSPRGEEVVRIHALEREVKALRQLRDVFGREKDKAEELCQQKERENFNLTKKMERLQAELMHMTSNADRVPLLEDQLLTMEKQNASMTRQLHEAEKRASSAEKFTADLKFELRKMDIKQEHLEKQLAEKETAMRMRRDESEAVEQLRKELLEAQHQNSVKDSTIHELRNRLQNKEMEFESRLNDKEQEKETYWQMLDQCKTHTEDTMLKSENELKRAREEKANLQRKLTENEKALNELSGFLNNLNDINAGLHYDKADLVKTNASMTRQLHEAEKRASSAEKLAADLNFELHKMDIKQEHLEKQLAEKETAMRMRRDRSEAVEQLRKKLLEAQYQNSVKDSTIHELRNRLQNKEMEFESRLNDKEQEKETYWQILDQCKTHTEDTMLKSENELKRAREEKPNDEERLNELRERNRRYQPHMRSHYLPESAHLTKSKTDLNVMP